MEGGWTGKSVTWKCSMSQKECGQTKQETVHRVPAAMGLYCPLYHDCLLICGWWQWMDSGEELVWLAKSESPETSRSRESLWIMNQKSQFFLTDPILAGLRGL